MIKKNQLIEIDETDVFRNDTLKREDIVKDLSKILISNTDPFVLSINASWGSGKTTFVKMWQAYLKKDCNVHSIYFSAWEDDFSSEPLISILGSLNAYIRSEFPPNSSERTKIKDVIKKSGAVVKKVAPSVIKGITGGMLDLDAGYEAAIASLNEEVSKSLIENYSDNKNILNEFKKSIENILKEIDKDKPFIIFIDELDRCRPLYSIELLERIKHIFGIKNLTFVLSIDKSQLTESIKSQYGNIDADKYLNRFIDLEYRLNNIELDSFCDNLYKKFNLEEILTSKGIEKEVNIKFHHKTILKKLATLFNLSLRDIEQVFTKLGLLFSTIKPHLFDSHFRVFVFFEMLKSYDSQLYYDLISGKNIDKIKNLVLPPFKNENIYSDVSIIFETIIDSIGKSENEYSKLIKSKQKEYDLLEIESQNLAKERHSKAFDELEEVDLLIKEIKLNRQKLDRYLSILETGFDHFGDYKLNSLISTVIKKIEFTDQFNFETIS